MVTNVGAKAKQCYGDILGLKQLVSAPNPVPKHAPGIDGGIGIRGVALSLQDANRFAKSMAGHGLPEPKFLTGKTGVKVARYVRSRSRRQLSGVPVSSIA